MTPVRRTAVREALGAFLALAALGMIFFAPSLFGGRTLLLRDLFTQFQGPRWWYRISLQAGEIPYWNPFIACGDAFLANPQNQVLYPLSLLFLILPFGTALAAYAALHCVLLGFFSYLLGRKWGLPFWGALLAGIVAGFAGLPIKQVEFLEMVGGFAWTPLVLLGAWACLTEPHPRWAALLGGALGMQLLAGSPYPPLYSCLGIACAMASQAGSLPQRWRTRTLAPSALCLAAGVALGVAVGCAQYLPTLLIVGDLPPSELAQIMQPRFSLRLRDLLDFVSPWLAGFPNWQKCFYVGVVPLFFAVLAIMPQKQGVAGAAGRSRPNWLFAILLVVAGCLFAQGDYLGIDHLMAVLPLAGRAAKWPTICLSISIVGLALLAGAGLGRWLGARRPAGAAAWLMWMGPLGVFTGALALDAIRGGPWLGQIRDLLKEPMLVFRSQALAMNFPMGPEAARLAFIGAALGVLLLSGFFASRRRALGPAACVLAAAELFSAGRNLDFQSPVDVYSEGAPPSVRQLLGDHYDAGSTRVLVPDTFSHFGDIVYGSDVLDDFRVLRGMFDQDTVMSWRVFTTQGGGSIHLPAYQYGLQPLLDKLGTFDSPAAYRILGAWNVGLILKGGIDEKGMHCDFVPNPYVLPRARLVEATVNVPNVQDAGVAIAQGKWNPATVLATWDQHLPDAAGGADEPGTVDRLAYGPGGIRIACEARRSCLLVLAENWAEGWTVRVDGVPSVLCRVNFLQQAVRLEPGRHEVVFRYVAPGAHGGFLLAGLGICGIGFCAMTQRRK